MKRGRDFGKTMLMTTLAIGCLVSVLAWPLAGAETPESSDMRPSGHANARASHTAQVNVFTAVTMTECESLNGRECQIGGAGDPGHLALCTWTILP